MRICFTAKVFVTSQFDEKKAKMPTLLEVMQVLKPTLIREKQKTYALHVNALFSF